MSQTMKKILLALILLCRCSAPPQKSTVQTPAAQPVKLLVVFDGTVKSIQKPLFIDISTTGQLIDKLKEACMNKLSAHPDIEQLVPVELIGGGLKRSKQYAICRGMTDAIDSMAPPFSVSKSTDQAIEGSGDALFDLCRFSYLIMKDSLGSDGMQSRCRKPPVLEQLQQLATATGTEYCLINSCFGTIRKKPVSAGTKAGVALATGALSLLISGGTAVSVFVPGDETSFSCRSVLVNLQNGDVVWTRRFSRRELYAVEHVNSYFWASTVFKKFSIKRRRGSNY